MDLMPDSPQLLKYLSVLFGPFVQEDAAVFYAAALSASEESRFPVYYALITIGLFISDIWKYWIGWGALKHRRGHAMSQRSQVMAFQDKVQQHTISALFTARFVPLARVPAYVACGFFKVPYWKFCSIIACTAVIYTVVVFAIVHLLGEILGERLEWILPIIGGCLALIFGTVHFFRWRARKKQMDAENSAAG